MKIILFLVFIKGILILFAGCKNGKKGPVDLLCVVEKVDSNGNKIKYQVNSMGQKQGYYKEYYRSGKLLASGNFKDNERDGRQEFFFENGKMLSLSYFKESKIDSVQKWFYMNGAIKSEYFWMNGKQFGLQKKYDSLGLLQNAYFILGCDTCMVSDLVFDKNGAVLEKHGSLVSLIVAKDTPDVDKPLDILFYCVVPPGYQYKFTQVKKSGTDYSRIQMDLSIVNNNYCHLYSEPLSLSKGDLVGGRLDIYQNSADLRLSDSVFYFIK